MRKQNFQRISKPKSTVTNAVIRKNNKRNKNRTKVSQPHITEKKSKNFTG